MTKPKIFPAEVLRADTTAFFGVLNEEPDFSVVVVSAGYLDACLGSLLHGFLIKSSVTERLLNPQGGALGSFAARSDVAYCLGLINKSIYQDLQHIAVIRNMVAHHYLSSQFSDAQLEAACLKLSHIGTMQNGDIDELLFPPERMPPAQERFKITVVVIADSILRKAESAIRMSADG